MRVRIESCEPTSRCEEVDGLEGNSIVNNPIGKRKRLIEINLRFFPGGGAFAMQSASQSDTLFFIYCQHRDSRAAHRSLSDDFEPLLRKVS
jgi:hypothetical protein